jgi:hypothetical protein
MNATKHQQNVIDGTIRTTGRTLAVIEIDHDDERQIVAVKEEYLTDPEFEAFCGECLAVCRLNYNRAVQQTSREELLLNLVRMRYHESEEFLGVSSITGQYTYTADLVARSIWPKNIRCSVKTDDRIFAGAGQRIQSAKTVARESGNARLAGIKRMGH